MKNIFKQLIIILILALFSWAAYALTPSVQAQNNADLWGDNIAGEGFGAEQLEEVGLGNNDPRLIVVNIIRILLGLLGVIAVALIMYGGFVWMTANGDADKIDKAKNILRNAVIGLLIILSAFAIVSFILSRLTDATGARSANYCLSGEVEQCRPGDCYRTCTNGSWGPCLGADCGVSSGGGDEDISCDGQTLLPGCQADNNICLPYNKYCDASSCTCKSQGGYGDVCGEGEDEAECNQNSEQCAAYLSCGYDETDDRCECSGPPIIQNVTPVGGYCLDDLDTYCLTDADCATGSCDQATPNGAVGNLVTIQGNNFLSYDPAVSQVLFWDGTDYNIEASLASTVNNNCDTSWTNEQVIVVVPAGAVTGGLKITADNGSDTTSLAPGPNLPDFVVNNINRPGLCKLDPVSGITDASLNYHGINLSGLTAYFGNTLSNVKANSSSFASNLSGTATVPNINPGKTTTFVQGSPNSNYLSFIKEVEQPDAPLIVSIDPATGPEGQYVTITGQGFGPVQGRSMVYFGQEEADFSFPSVCANSVWGDNQIVVKVPSGLSDDNLYDVVVEVNNQTAISPTQFKYDEKIVLSTGLCLVDPIFGQNNDEMQLWGEYFGDANANNKVRYYLNQDQTADDISYWDKDTGFIGARPDKVETTIAPQAVSGPVQIIKWDSKNNNELASNGVYLTIGSCQSDDDCGAGVCCPNSTPEAGRCQPTPDLCYGSTESSVYEWAFSTGNDVDCPPEKPAQCDDGSCCSSQRNCQDLNDNGFTSCTDDNSCAGYGAKLCVDSIFCPNSPGSCSQNPTAVVYGGTCNCAVLGCLNCNFDNNLKRCVSNTDTCSLETTAPDVDGQLNRQYCAVYNGVSRWHLETNKTCPADFATKTPGGDCVDQTSSCDLCSSGLSCYDNEGYGVCASQYQVCANNFECINDVCTRSEGLCECCCDKTQNNPDDTNPACCAPLACDNYCGSSAVDPDDSDDQWGYCSGCADVGTTQAEHDAACNCSGTSGKYCDTSVPGGICRDCSQIGNASECSNHDSCCVDFQKGNACIGATLPDADGDGFPEQRSTVFDNNIKYCGYYICEDNCAQPTKGIDDSGGYVYLDKCTEDCPISCDADLTNDVCDADNSLCPTDKPYCGEDCLCTSEKKGIGEECYDEFDSCSLPCVPGYTCLDVAGFSSVGAEPPGTEDSCRCCCDATLSEEDDLCKAVDVDLFCQPNTDNCTGQERGLCCGCQNDAQCGDEESIGCGLDTCCKPRPAVDKVYPVLGEEGACRNTLISVAFDRQMNEGSLAGNIIVAGDYGQDLCPTHTELLTELAVQSEDLNWLERAWRSLRDWLARLTGQEATAADPGNFCVVTGKTVSHTVVAGSEEKTIAQFKLDAPLDPGIRYYVIVKGDKNLDSQNGVMSIDGIGMNGENQDTSSPPLSSFNGITYPRSHIWSFKTDDQICQVEEVEIVPNQHLFQQPFIDYVFEARALVANDQYVQRISGVYNWQWDWSIDNVDIATVSYDKSDDNLATVTSGNREDAHTWLRAKATITEDAITPLSTKGREIEGKARVILFLCANPWPAVDDPNIWPVRWIDRNDNCDICVDPVTGLNQPCEPDADCLDNNFSLYYCRDKGTSATADDLPSLVLDPAIRGKYNYVGANGLVEVLKDFLFSREDRPFAPAEDEWTITNDSSADLGRQAVLDWTTSKDFIYKVYYGQKSGRYDNFVLLEQSAPLTISGLENGQTYYFAMTSINDNRVESLLSSEKTVVISDVSAPARPVNFWAEVNALDSSNIKIESGWDLAQSDVASYIIEYGPYQAAAIRRNAGFNNTYTIPNLDNLSLQDYYIRVMAVDNAGNQSQPVQLFCEQGCTDRCECEL